MINLGGLLLTLSMPKDPSFPIEKRSEVESLDG